MCYQIILGKLKEKLELLTFFFLFVCLVFFFCQTGIFIAILFGSFFLSLFFFFVLVVLSSAQSSKLSLYLLYCVVIQGYLIISP